MRSRKPLPLLECRFEHGADFLERFTPGRPGQPGVLFIPLAEHEQPPIGVYPGMMVSVTIHFEDRREDFHLHALVIERVIKSGSTGLRLAFLKEEPLRQEIVIACAEGESVPYIKRRSERIPVSLSVRLTRDEETFTTTTTEISSAGLHLLLAEPLPLDSVITLEVQFRDGNVRMRGRVASTIAAGPQKGSGIEFLFDSKRSREEMLNRVQALARSTAPKYC